MTTKLPRITAPRAADICRHFELSEGAAALLTPDQVPGAFLDLVLAKELWLDAVRLLAHGLGRREAVWWACVAVRSVLGPSTPPVAVAALRAAETWAYQPTEQTRWAAHDAAEATKFDHPAGWAAMGAFWSGGSIAPPIEMPPGQPAPPPVPPGPFMTAMAVTNAIMLSALEGDPAGAPEKYQRFIRQGVDIANGGPGAG